MIFIVEETSLLLTSYLSDPHTHPRDGRASPCLSTVFPSLLNGNHCKKNGALGSYRRSINMTDGKSVKVASHLILTL